LLAYFCFMQIPAHAFCLPLTVAPEHIDQLNHVNNVVYLQWLQGVATAHWESLTTPAQRLPYAWVVRRQEIDYLRPCFLGDQLLAYTWVLPPQGAVFDRQTVIVNSQTQKQVIAAKTTWYLLDAATMRTLKVTAEIMDWFGVTT